jgi:uncharacterized membrane protein YgcG
MLAYRRADWEALARNREIGRWSDEGYLEASVAEALLARFPYPCYSPNAFFRVGLFAFGLICASAGLGLFFLGIGTSSPDETGVGTLLLIYGSAGVAITEMLIRRSNPFFRAGLEEAACYAGIGCLVGGFLFLTLPQSGGHLHAWVLLPIAALTAAAALRYADRLLAVVAFLTLVCFGSYIARDSGTAGVYLLPASIIALSALAAWGCHRASRARALAPWDPIWKTLRFSGLMIAYAAGNYWIMREWGAGWILDRFGAAVPSAWAFYAYTFAVPLGYLAWGLARKDRLCLDAGLVTIALAVLTYKAYHNVIPVETGLTLAGIALLAVAWISLKVFRPPRFGLSAEARPRLARGSLLDAEALAAWAAFGGGSHPGKVPEGFQGGGGSFGGGGAQGGF